MTKRNRVAIILAGCGGMDGAEINEAVMALYAISCNGLECDAFAPNINQYHVFNHLSGEVETSEVRNVLVESARIMRGNISPLEDLKVENYDAVIFVGGFGGAKNLSTFAFDGENMKVLDSVEKVILSAYESKIAIGAMCITPVFLAKVLAGRGVVLSVGGAEDIGKMLVEKFGAVVENIPSSECTIDIKNRIVTTPAFMNSDTTLRDLGKGVDAMVKAIMNL